jgi:four helix bundle protein
MKIHRFEDLTAWQKAQDLAVFTYSNFGQIKDFSFRDQICRASVSVSNNIAEGFDRGSDKDFLRFLYIARASNSETKSMLYLADRLIFIPKIEFEKGIAMCEEVSKIINGLINYLHKAGHQLD